MKKIIYYEGLGSGNFVRNGLINPLKAKYPVLDVEGHSWSEDLWKTSVSRSNRGGPVIAIGHSFGGNAILKWATQYQGTIDLLLTLDPRQFPFGFPIGGFSVPKNVRLAVNFYEKGDFLLQGFTVSGASNKQVSCMHWQVPAQQVVFDLVRINLGVNQ